MEIIETNLEFNKLTERKSTNRIILHHSGVTVRQSVETIHNYHKNTRKWAGIGYHFYVRTTGEIYRGRPEKAVGAHASGSNSDSIGICFEGDYNQETMSEAQIKAGQELVSYLKEKYSITAVQRHSDVCNTSCPGSNFPFEDIVNGQATEVKQEDLVTKDWQHSMNVSYGCGLKEDGDFGRNSKKECDKHQLYYTSGKAKFKNEHVKFIQERLCIKGFNTAIDGSFGPDASNKTKSFQKAHNLKVDGYVGINTTKALLK